MWIECECKLTEEVKVDTTANGACDWFGSWDLNENATVLKFKAAQIVAQETRMWIECKCKLTEEVKDNSTANGACDWFGSWDLNENATVLKFKAAQIVAQETRMWIECKCKLTEEVKDNTTANGACDWFGSWDLNENATVLKFKPAQIVAQETLMWIECKCKLTGEVKVDTTANGTCDWFGSCVRLYETSRMRRHLRLECPLLLRSG